MKDSGPANPCGETATQNLTGDADAAIRIVTGARLHFGLLDTAEPFGGAGVMIDEPNTEIVVQRAREFACSGPRSARVESVARQIANDRAERCLPKVHIHVVKCAPQHCGLGSGTQLSLAVAEGIARIVGESAPATDLVCRLARRGQRSAVGSHGFFCGGLICETPHDQSPLNPIQARIELPIQWRVVVFLPKDATTKVSGEDEAKKFSRLLPASHDVRERLQEMITSRLIPAAEGENFDEFADAVHDYNRHSGELFKDVQGGPYNGPAVTKLIERLRERGARGVGQSSWGPGVFAWFESPSHWDQFACQWSDTMFPAFITTVRNQGRDLAADKPTVYDGESYHV